MAGKRKQFLQRYGRLILGGTQGKLPLLFERAAEYLGIPWRGSKQHGYELLEQLYVKCHGVKGVTNNPIRNAVKKATKKSRQLAQAASDEFLSSYAWRRLRMEVLIEQGRRCKCCGATPDNGVMMHVDHIKPRRLFPELALERSNLQVLCEVCNHGKGNWDQTDWQAEQVDPAKVLPVWSKRIN